jgi:hypothetical protein
VNLLRPYRQRDKTQFPDIPFKPSVLFSIADDCDVNDVDGIPSVVSSKEISFDEKVKHLTESQQQEIRKLLCDVENIFSDIPGKTTLCTHHIAMKHGSKPVRSSPYRMNPEKTKYLETEIENLLKLGIIEESDSSYASPVVLVPKSNNELRLCTDFRKVNLQTVADPFPMPRVEELIDRVGKATFITKLDMSRGYWQVPLDEQSIPVSAFVTPFGHFQWKYMPFGLRNAPATFSRLVSKLFRGLESFSAAYLDDFIIFSASWSDHLKHLKIVFERIRAAGLTLNLKKCVFGAAEVDFLGHHIGLGRVQPREKKVEAVLKFQSPVNQKQLRSYLGLVGYFRKFLPNYAHTTQVLTDLLKKNTKFVWTTEAEQAFLDLKSRLASRPILRPPDFSLPFSMAVDASNVAIGANLFQVVDEIEHPICYFSRKLDKHQRNYSTVEKEALGLLLAVRAFRIYFGSEAVKVFTDHNPLVFLNKTAHQNKKLLRWSLELQQYNLEIIHRKGKDNLLPDWLSRTTIE